MSLKEPMEDQKTYQEIIPEYNFPSVLAQSIAELYALDGKGTDFANQAKDASSDAGKSEYTKMYEQYREQEGLFFYQNFLPTLISVLKDRSNEERKELYKTLKKCNEDKPFILGESPDAHFDVIEGIIENFDISPKTKNPDTQSVITELKLRINKTIEQ